MFGSGLERVQLVSEQDWGFDRSQMRFIYNLNRV